MGLIGNGTYKLYIEYYTKDTEEIIVKMDIADYFSFSGADPKTAFRKPLQHQLLQTLVYS